MSQIIELEVGWNKLQVDGIDRLEEMVENRNQEDPKLFSLPEWPELYILSYNMCTQKSPYNWSEQLYERHGKAMSDYLTRKVLPALKDKHGEPLLIEFVRRSENHGIMNKWYQKIFMFLDRYHVKYHQLPSLQDAGLHYYKTIIFDAIKTEVTAVIIELINNERSGAVIDKELIKCSIQVYEKMGEDTLQELDTTVLEFLRNYLRVAEKERVVRALEEELVREQRQLEEARAGQPVHSENDATLLLAVEEVLSARQ